MNSYDVVPYAPEHKTRVLALLKHLGRTRLPERTAYFEWKFERNPYIEPLLYVSLAGDEVVGMRGIFGTRWEIDGQRHVLPCATNLVIAPEHRRRGIVKQVMDAVMAELCRRGFPYVINTSATSITHLASLSLGWRGIGALGDMRQGTVSDHQLFASTSSPVRRYVTRLFRRGRAYAKRRLFGSRAPFSRFDRATRERPITGVTVQRTPRPEAMAALIERIGHDGRMRHVRDVEYLRWRYQNPLAEYRFVFREGDQGIDGYLVLSTKRRVHADEVELFVVDLEATTSDARCDLLGTVLGWSGHDALAIWAGGFDSRLATFLIEHDFEPTIPEVSITQPQRTVLVRPTGNCDRNGPWMMGKRNLLNVANWDMRMIYSDGF